MTEAQRAAQAARDKRAKEVSAKENAAILRDQREDIDELRREYADRIKPYRPSLDAAANIETLITDKATATSPSAQLGVIYSIGKLLDPGSVIRESEVQLYQSGLSWMQQAGRQIQQQLEGGKLLTQQQLNDMAHMAKLLHGGAQRAVGNIRADLEQVVTERGYKPEQIFGRARGGVLKKAVDAEQKPTPAPGTTPAGPTKPGATKPGATKPGKGTPFEGDIIKY